MFTFLKNTFQKIFNTVTSKIQTLFSRTTVDTQTIIELEKILIEADAGVTLTKSVISKLQQQAQSRPMTGHELKKYLHSELSSILHATKPLPNNPTVFLFVGINGSGKTTTIAKLAYSLHRQGKKVLVAAADTFRAAAVEQLSHWCTIAHATLLTGKENQEPASVVYAACETFAQGAYDILIIDTAGRLQTKIALMKELEKIRKIINLKLPHHTSATLLTIDSMLGQNSCAQAKLFNESTPLDGLVLTKMDGTGKGAIIFAITHELGIPIMYLTFGENIDAIMPFDNEKYIQQLLG